MGSGTGFGGPGGGSGDPGGGFFEISLIFFETFLNSRYSCEEPGLTISRQDGPLKKGFIRIFLIFLNKTKIIKTSGKNPYIAL